MRRLRPHPPQDRDRGQPEKCSADEKCAPPVRCLGLCGSAPGRRHHLARRPGLAQGPNECLGRSEAIGWQRWLLVLLGFVGAILVIRPSIHGVSPGVLFALASGTAYGSALIATRKLASHDPALAFLAVPLSEADGRLNRRTS